MSESKRHRLLGWWARFVTRHPFWVLFPALAGVVISLVMVFGTIRIGLPVRVGNAHHAAVLALGVDALAVGEHTGHVARLVDAGRIKTTLGETYGRINAANLRRAHALIESGKAKGKIVLEGF